MRAHRFGRTTEKKGECTTVPCAVLARACLFAYFFSPYLVSSLSQQTTTRTQQRGAVRGNKAHKVCFFTLLFFRCPCFAAKATQRYRAFFFVKNEEKTFFFPALDVPCAAQEGNGAPATKGDTWRQSLCGIDPWGSCCRSFFGSRKNPYKKAKETTYLRASFFVLKTRAVRSRPGGKRARCRARRDGRRDGVGLILEKGILLLLGAGGGGAWQRPRQRALPLGKCHGLGYARHAGEGGRALSAASGDSDRHRARCPPAGRPTDCAPSLRGRRGRRCA
nr:hypothetical protein [Pandoravirus massiliensis]